ncbi:MAG: hypothetical protein FOGNACKC_02732 [Anaerolineae bacterium]|nr:hypothetical protein [Anaerolineae bacterium]
MTSKPAPPNPTLIKASELGEFEFCRRAWWYRHIKKFEPARRERLADGQARHAEHHGQVQTAIRWQWLGLALVAVGLLMLLGAMALGAG